VVYAGRPATAAGLAALAWSPWTWASQAMTFWSAMSLALLQAATRRE
jgi:hypothetical protein